MSDSVVSWTDSQKLREAILRSKKYLPASLGAQIDVLLTSGQVQQQGPNHDRVLRSSRRRAPWTHSNRSLSKRTRIPAESFSRGMSPGNDGPTARITLSPELSDLVARPRPGVDRHRGIGPNEENCVKQMAPTERKV